ncbi:MAG: CARDB domain-containing protein [Candidatus Thermoplasmatota archaeon]|nr:CARDB domain-containing protein [Candidatus Thermoplasmatota archaeon]
MRSRGLPMLLTLLLICSGMTYTVSADTVIRADDIELLPAGDFSDPQEWTLSTNKAYSEDVAEYTVAMLTDQHISFTHNRPDNHDDFLAWSSFSSSGDNLSLGAPDCPTPSTIPVCDADGDGVSDGGFSWSKGPTIETQGFDLSEGGTNTIVNVSLVVAFRIPETLQTDSVDIVIQSSGQSHLIKTYAHTMNPVNYMQNNARYFSLDAVKQWTWQDLSQINVLVDYVSVGGTDDSEVQVDAVGLWVSYLKPWGTFEMAKATHSTTLEHIPIVSMDVNNGTYQDLSSTPCGLENIGSSSGVWTSEPLVRPFGQDWGLFHPDVDGNASWKVSVSPDGNTWTSGSNIAEFGQLPDTENIRFEATLLDGCIKGAAVDINNPTLTVSGSITGSTASMVSGIAFVKFAMNGEELGTFNITPGSFTHSFPVGHLLSEGNDLDLGVSTRFHWSSNGSSESLVVTIDEMDISGGYVVEWDYDPICDQIPDQFFDEDGNGRLINFLYTCMDDITPNSDLTVTVVSDSPQILEGSFVNGQIRLQPQPNAYGNGTVQISVSDERQNEWNDFIDFTIISINDQPTMDSLPPNLEVEVGETVGIEFSFDDVDSNPSNLDLTFNSAWVTYSAGILYFAPLSVGDYVVTISVNDEESTITQNVSVSAKQRAELFVQSIGVRNLESTSGEGKLSSNTAQVIEIFVKNTGDSIAQPVSVRCSVDGRIIDNTQIALISPGSVVETSCDWIVLESPGVVEVSVEIDWTLTIDETNEGNNIFTTPMEIFEGAEESGEKSSSDDELPISTIIWISAMILGIIGVVMLMIGPNRIREIR